MALANDPSSDVHLNQALTPPVPHCQLAVGGADRVHMATHAEFNPGGSFVVRLHTGTQSLSLNEVPRSGIAMMSICLPGDQMLAVDGTPLISQFTEHQQSCIAYFTRHSFLWFHVELIGTAG